VKVESKKKKDMFSYEIDGDPDKYEEEAEEKKEAEEIMVIN